MIMQYMAANNSCKYLEVLPKIVENYSNTYHTIVLSSVPVPLSSAVIFLVPSHFNKIFYFYIVGNGFLMGDLGA